MTTTIDLGQQDAPGTSLPARRSWLPAGWPVTFLLVGYPVLWALGLSAFALQFAAIPMAIQLARRPQIRVPRGFGIWLLFLLVSVLGILVLGLDPPNTLPNSVSGRLIGYTTRETEYLAATVLLLYVGNMRRELTDSKIIRALAALFVSTVVLGVLALLWPYAAFTSPFEMILPHAVTSNSYAYHLVHPALAQVQDFGGSTLPRPAAPFAYTNEWGFVVTVLAIWFTVWIVRSPSPTRVLLGAATLGAGVIAMLLSLNRGVWLALVLGVVYLVFAMLRRGHVVPLLALMLTVTALAAIALGTPVRQTLETRLANGNSDSIRAFTSRAALELAQESPVIGFGSTRASVGSPSSIAVGKSASCPQCGNFPIGMNGYIFTLLVSTGVVGTLLFVLFWLYQIWLSRGDPSLIASAVRLTLVISLFFGFFYDLAPIVPFIALGIMWRRRESPEPLT